MKTVFFSMKKQQLNFNVKSTELTNSKKEETKSTDTLSKAFKKLKENELCEAY